MFKYKALIIEDDKPIRNFIRASLESNDYIVCEAETASQGLMMHLSEVPDVLLVDLGLPDLDGIELIKRIRSYSQTPIIVVSAREREGDKIEALDQGADDYLTKPFGIGELLARVRVALRHKQPSDAHQSEAQLVHKALTVHFEKHKIYLGETEVHLTPYEYKLLVLFMKYPGKVLTYNYLIKSIWGVPIGNEMQTLRVLMANIRRKIEKNPSEPEYIETEMGIGYRMKE